MFKFVLILAFCVYAANAAPLTQADLNNLQTFVNSQTSFAGPAGLSAYATVTAQAAVAQSLLKASLDIATLVQVQNYVEAVAAADITAAQNVLQWACTRIDATLDAIRNNSYANVALQASVALQVSANSALLGLLNSPLPLITSLLALNQSSIDTATNAVATINVAVSVNASLSVSLTMYSAMKVSCKSDFDAQVAADAIGATVSKLVVDIKAKVEVSTFLSDLNWCANLSTNVQSVDSVLPPVEDDVNGVLNLGITATIVTDTILTDIAAAQASSVLHLLACISARTGSIATLVNVTAPLKVGVSASITLNVVLRADVGIAANLAAQYYTLLQSPILQQSVGGAVQAELGYLVVNPNMNDQKIAANNASLTVAAKVSADANIGVALVQADLRAKVATALIDVATVKASVTDSTHLVIDNIKNSLTGIVAGLVVLATNTVKDFLYIDLRVKAYIVLRLRLESSILNDLLSASAQGALAQVNSSVVLGQIENEYIARETAVEVAQNLSIIAHDQLVNVGAKFNETRDLVEANVAAMVAGNVAVFAEIKAQLDPSVVAAVALHVNNILMSIHNDILDLVNVNTVVVGNVQATLNVVLSVKLGVTLAASDLESLRAHVVVAVATTLKTTNATAGPVVQSAKRSIFQSNDSTVTVPMTVTGPSGAPSTSGGVSPSSSTGTVSPSSSTGTVSPSSSTGTVSPSSSTGTVSPSSSTGAVTPPPGPVSTSASSTYLFGVASLLVVLVASFMQL